MVYPQALIVTHVTAPDGSRTYAGTMLSGRFTQTLLSGIDRVISKTSTKDTQTPAHQRTGGRGEGNAYFYLRRRGYVMVARNFRTARHHGEIDLIGVGQGRTLLYRGQDPDYARREAR